MITANIIKLPRGVFIFNLLHNGMIQHRKGRIQLRA